VLSVIRNLQLASSEMEWNHAVWVSNSYVETRRPALQYRFARHACGDSPSHLKLLIKAFRSLPQLTRLLSSEPFDVLHSHTRGTLLVAILLARLWRRQVAFTNHNFARRVAFYRWASRQSRIHTVVLTPNMARHYGLEAHLRVRIISACCADSFFAGDLPRAKRLNRQPNRVRLIGIGNVVRWKNWHLLAAAISQLTPQEQARLEFIHWGPVPADPDSERYDCELREAVLRFGLKDQFVFRGPTSSVLGCLRDADWFVLPSTNEPCSVALIEALASGVPSLVSASGGNVDIVQHGRTGLLFQPDSAQDLASKLRDILTSRHKLLPADDIRESVRSRSASVVTAEYAKLYQEIRTESAAQLNQPRQYHCA
jgi:glycosyltransferase involved in cell wall biosynthesis